MVSQPRFTGVTTFARLPMAGDGPVDIALIGVPFDQGASFRPGQRFAPAAIREASRLLRQFHPVTGADVLGGLRARDCGDAPIGGDVASSLTSITGFIAGHVGRGAVPIMLGGDHTISLPALRAVASKRPVAIVHLDAHSDTEDVLFGSRYNHGTPFRRAIEEGLIDVTRSTQVGLRGSLADPAEWDNARALGLKVIPMHEAARRSMEDLGQELRQRAGDGPVYVSVDVDACDPAFAPGTGVPETGGFSARELIELLRALRGVRLAGGDVVEVLPSQDAAGITALLAANVAYELIALAV